MNDWEKWRERVRISLRAARHDDDDDDFISHPGFVFLFGFLKGVLILSATSFAPA